MTSTEQEIRRGAPARAGVPRTAPAKTGARRPNAPAAEAAQTASKAATRTVTRPGTSARPATTRPRPAEGAAGAARVRRPMPRKQRAPFVLLVVGLLCGGLISLLLLNTVLNRDSFTQSTLRDEIAQLQRESSSLEQQIIREEQPGALADKAEKQGQAWDPTANSIEVGANR
ncbi:hypothetical protein [Nonomuraea africana]|uniref:hypothetical protein n=1 Tax=Nonomuraea africana TaxID=46171 RepID=UPI0033C7D1FC